MPWSKPLTRPSDDSGRSVCAGARRRTPFHLESALANRCTDSECATADCSRITCKLRALALGAVAGGSFHRLPAGGWILVPSRTAGVGNESAVLPSKKRREKPCTECHLAPFGGIHITGKVRCWLECGFTPGWSSRIICSTVSHL